MICSKRPQPALNPGQCGEGQSFPRPLSLQVGLQGARYACLKWSCDCFRFTLQRNANMLGNPMHVTFVGATAGALGPHVLSRSAEWAKRRESVSYVEHSLSDNVSWAKKKKQKTKTGRMTAKSGVLVGWKTTGFSQKLIYLLISIEIIA